MRKLRTLMFALAVGSGLVAVAPTVGAQETTCPPGFVVIGDGVGAQGGQGMASVWADAFAKANPAWKVDRLDFQPDSSDATNRVGIDLFKKYFRDRQAQCPAAVVYGVGHSAGAMALGDGTAELVKEGTDVSDLRLDLISDPMRPGNPEGRGFKLVMPLPLPGIQMPVPPRGPLGAAVVRQTCNENDLICNAPDPILQPLVVQRAIGYFTTSHRSVEVPPVMPPRESADVLHRGR